jgi:DNA modification methylase
MMDSWAERTTEADRVRVFHGDSRAVLKAFPDAHFDSVVCDPPYALVSITKRFGAEGAAPAQVGASGAYARASAGFMGQKWDTGETAFAVEFWAEVFRVLKPGGHVIAFSGTRTYHRLAVAIEDAGFEIRDMIAWLYGSGFPKSHDVSKGIAKRRVEDVEPVRVVCRFVRAAMDSKGLKSRDLTQHFGDCNARLIDHWAARDTDSQPSLPTPAQWETLKAVLALPDDMDAEVDRLNGRKGERGEVWNSAEVVGEVASSPAGFGEQRFTGDRTIRELDCEWQGWGTALKPALEPVVLARKPLQGTVAANVLQHGTGALNIDASRIDAPDGLSGGGQNNTVAFRTSPTVDQPRSEAHPKGRWPANVIHDGSEEVVGAFPETGIGQVGGNNDPNGSMGYHGGAGGVSLPGVKDGGGSAARYFYSAKADAEDRLGSRHPTVKPVDLMAYLVRLVTPPGGLTLDPFAGSGTTGVGAMRGGFRAVLIEREDAYVEDIVRKLAWARGEGRLTTLEQARIDTPEKQAAASGAGLPLFGDA